MNHPLVLFLQNEKVKNYYIFLFNCEKITKYSKWFKYLFNLIILGLIIKDINDNYEFLASFDKFMDNILSPNFYIILAYSSIKYYIISKILFIILNIITNNNNIKEIYDKYFINFYKNYYISILSTWIMLTLFTLNNNDYPLIFSLKDLIIYLVIIHLCLGFIIDTLYINKKNPLITLIIILIMLLIIIITIFNIKECLEFMDMFIILKINGNNGPPLGPSGNRDPSGPPGSQGPPGPHNSYSHLGQDSSNDIDSSNNRRDYNNRRPNSNRDPFNPNRDPFNQNRDPFNPNRDPFDSYNNRDSFDPYNNGYPYNNGSQYDPYNYNNSSNQVIPGPSNSQSGPSNSEVLNCSTNSGVITQSDTFERKAGLFDSLGIKRYDPGTTAKNKIKKDKERAKLDQLKIDNPTAYQREMQKRSFANRQGSPGTQWGKEIEKAKRNETRKKNMNSRSINLNPLGLTAQELQASMNRQSGIINETNYNNNNGCYPQTNWANNNSYYPQTNWANNTNNQSSMPFGNESRIINEINNNNNNRNLNQNNRVNSSNNFDMTNQNNRVNSSNNFDMTNQNNRVNNTIHPNINTSSSIDIEMLNRLNTSISSRNFSSRNNNGVNNNNSPNLTNRNNIPRSPRQDQN